MLKTITVDLNNPSDMKKWISYLQKKRKDKLTKLGYTGCKFNGERVHLDSYLKILDSFIESLEYEPGEYYVYAHCNPKISLQPLHHLKDAWLLINFPHLKHRPFYIGKGTKDRYKNLSRNDSHRKIRSSLIKSNQDIIPVLLKTKLSEKSALELEERLIDVLGLIALGKENYLVNLDEGLSFRRSNYSKDQLKIVRSNKFTF